MRYFPEPSSRFPLFLDEQWKIAPLGIRGSAGFSGSLDAIVQHRYRVETHTSEDPG